jgi:ATP-binding cassette subfamily C protein CydD
MDANDSTKTATLATDPMARRRAARAWTRAQSRLGRRAAMPAVLSGLAGTALAIFAAWCIAQLLAAALSGRALEPRWFAGVVVAALVRAGLMLISDLQATRAGAAARRRLRADSLARLLAAGPAMLRGAHSGDWASAIVDRIEALDGLFARWLPASMLALASPGLVLLVLLAVDPTAALVLLAAGLVVPFGMALAGIGAAGASRRQFQALARLQARFLDRVRGIATIVLAGAAEAEAAALGKAAAELRVRTMRVLRVAFLSSVVLDLAAAAAVIVLALRGGDLLTAAPRLFGLLLVAEFFAPLRAYAAAYQDQLQAAGAAEALLDLPPLPEPIAAELKVRTVSAAGVSVAFEHVSFAWDKARGNALDDLGFRLAAGETMVLVGPSGAGKSTVIEILLGFVRPDSGRVLINGAPIESIVPAALSRLTAWIGQRPVLFAGTMAENIRFARPDATDAQIAEAARAARLDSVLADLPDGLATVIGEGGFGLSGGQAQRVAIARAFLKDAPLLLLDEPTAHLDPATEAEVLQSLRRLAVGRTVILASHAAAAHEFGGRRLDIRDGRAVPPGGRSAGSAA